MPDLTTQRALSAQESFLDDADDVDAEDPDPYRYLPTEVEWQEVLKYRLTQARCSCDFRVRDFALFRVSKSEQL